MKLFKVILRKEQCDTTVVMKQNAVKDSGKNPRFQARMCFIFQTCKLSCSTATLDGSPKQCPK